MAKTAAILGASTDPAKYGQRSVKAHLAEGYDVYPIHPTADEIAGLKAYRRVQDVPVRLDRVSVYLPPDVTAGLLDDLVAADPGEVWLNPGAESFALLEAGKAKGLNVVAGCSILALGRSPGEFGP